jgi:hypothetical protein
VDAVSMSLDLRLLKVFDARTVKELVEVLLQE